MWVALCSTAGFWTCEKKCVAGYSILVQCPLSTHKHIKLVNTQITCISQIKQGIMSNTTGCSPQELLYDILLSWHGLIPPSFNVSAVSPPGKKKKKKLHLFFKKSDRKSLLMWVAWCKVSFVPEYCIKMSLHFKLG